MNSTVVIYLMILGLMSPLCFSRSAGYENVQGQRHSLKMTDKQSNEVSQRLSVGLLVPYTTFKVRDYSRAVSAAIASLRRQDLSFLDVYQLRAKDISTDMLKVNPSPTGNDSK